MSDPPSPVILRTEDQRRWHGCLRKRSFPTSQSAYTAGRHQGMRRHTFTAYQCAYCGRWHLAKKKSP